MTLQYPEGRRDAFNSHRHFPIAWRFGDDARAPGILTENAEGSGRNAEERLQPVTVTSGDKAPTADEGFQQVTVTSGDKAPTPDRRCCSTTMSAVISVTVFRRRNLCFR